MIETYTRQADGVWGFRAYQGIEAVARLHSLNVDLPPVDIFAGVEFPSPTLPDGTF